MPPLLAVCPLRGMAGCQSTILRRHQHTVVIPWINETNYFNFTVIIYMIIYEVQYDETNIFVCDHYIENSFRAAALENCF